MKRVLILFVTILSLTAFTTPPAAFNIVGTWEGTVKGETFTMEFDKEGYAKLTKGNESFGGKEFDLNGKKLSMVYETNLNATPALVTISLKLVATGEQETMFTIGFKPLNDNEFIANIADENGTPDLNSPDCVVYKRK